MCEEAFLGSNTPPSTRRISYGIDRAVKSSLLFMMGTPGRPPKLIQGFFVVFSHSSCPEPSYAEFMTKALPFVDRRLFDIL